MAVAFAQSNSASGGNGVPSVTLAAAPTQGNLLVAAVAASSNTALTMNSAGWTALTSVATGTGGSSRALRMFYKVAGAGESSTVNATSVGTAAWGMAVAEYSGLSATPLNVENAQANASSTSQPSPSVTPSAGGGLAVACAFARSSALTFSGETISGTANEREDVAGTNVSLAIYDQTIATFSGSYAGAATATGSAVGGGGIAIFNAAAAAATSLPGLHRNVRNHLLRR